MLLCCYKLQLLKFLIHQIFSLHVWIVFVHFFSYFFLFVCFLNLYIYLPNDTSYTAYTHLQLQFLLLPESGLSYRCSLNSYDILSHRLQVPIPDYFLFPLPARSHRYYHQNLHCCRNRIHCRSPNYCLQMNCFQTPAIGLK